MRSTGRIVRYHFAVNARPPPAIAKNCNEVIRVPLRCTAMDDCQHAPTASAD